MGDLLRFPAEPDTFEVGYDFGRWCVVQRRAGRFVCRSYWLDRDMAEYMAEHFAKGPHPKPPGFNDRLPDWAKREAD